MGDFFEEYILPICATVILTITIVFLIVMFIKFI